MSQLSERSINNIEQWLQDSHIDEDTKQELRNLEQDPQELEDRFYKDLEFGTGGLRGIIGAGSNRVNRYTIGKATQGFAQFIVGSYGQAEGKPSVVIAYDSRHFSPEFALEAALVLAGNGIVAKLFPSLRTTPQLSFSVRDLGATGGIVITASHNPPEYNGYKVYNAEGGQLIPHEAEQVIQYIKEVEGFSAVKKLTQAEAEAQGLLVWLGEADDEAFVRTVAQQSMNSELIRTSLGEDFRIVYTPLHGTGNIPVRKTLEAIGFTNVHIVPEQEQPDAEFSTVKSPNPEEREAFTLAMKLGQELDADILIGTDPDCDRMGAVVKDKDGKYVVLSGNQSGAIMIHYLLSQLKESGKMPDNGIVIKTIVTSEMGASIARHYGAEVINTLTGFKYIGEKMTQYEQSGEYTYLFGYEESYGYLAGNYARDKDAVLAAMLIAEAGAYYKGQGKTLYDVLEELYEQFGYFQERLKSRTLKGKDGLAQIQSKMTDWRSQPPLEIAGVQVKEVLDYSIGLNGLPQENVLKFMLEDGSWFCLRPSGTEPKIKVYFAVRGESLHHAEEQIAKLVQEVMSRVDA
ncbi:phospho-sugar mutase [Paenibacillus macquariensis]|uniref:Phosphoglucomutase n=1 Tax=Paenibacillus macquariensis TaxID=948756 RepID=A0ABY1K6W7_9BACL|nr:phospho-sugar mutase [Paenibacillus macquariensis]MEC0092560.1 phospho-sugar mutase [Paenibacillus macquariensis]OAB35511.1 phosphoglucomutase [Paenibacillus macquariensis subsp. macquariensis]SIR34556.1 phosphoglucomutase [Paenibacillus macquariensis]